MCGITGIFNYSGGFPVTKDLVHRMCETIVHRGPDSEGVYTGSSGTAQIGLGIRRLAIIDLDTGNQPIHNEDQTIWVVLNGEIYNYQDLRAHLAGKHSFSTRSDTEVIVHLYEDYGEKCVDYLRGMFAFALWDGRAGKLFIARDRLGKKPLYYLPYRGALLFGSEIKSILAALPSTPETNLQALDYYLTYQYIPSPQTIFKDVHALSPAHVLTCGPDGSRDVRRYWQLDFRRKTDLSFPDACERMKELLAESTRLRMISDVPLGAFLSGGHDSSIIVGLMSGIASQPVKTFSIGFEEDDFSELPYARLAAKHFGTEHHEFILKPNFIDILPKIVWHYGQPFADSSSMPSYLVSRETRGHVTVALNGDGGDEAFGGYLRYKAMKGSLYFSLPFRLMGKKMTNLVASMVPHTETTRGRNMFRYMSRLVSALAEPPETRNIYWHCFFTGEAKKELYSDTMHNALTRDAFDYMRSIFENARAGDVMDRTMFTDIHAYLPECLLVKMDVASMAASLEARSPFLDHKVMEFSATLPSRWKVHGLTTKYIMKKTFDPMLPPEITRRGKMGFGIPVGRWFRTEWKDYFREMALSEKAVNRGYFNRKYLERLFNEHTQGVRDHGYRMWALLVLELWHRIYIDRDITP